MQTSSSAASASEIFGSTRAERSDFDCCENRCEPSNSRNATGRFSSDEQQSPLQSHQQQHCCELRVPFHTAQQRESTGSIQTRATTPTAAGSANACRSNRCCCCDRGRPVVPSTVTAAAAHDSVQQVAFAERTAQEMAEMVQWWYRTTTTATDMTTTSSALSVHSSSSATASTGGTTRMVIPNREQNATDRTAKDQAHSLPSNSLLWNETNESDDPLTVSQQFTPRSLHGMVDHDDDDNDDDDYDHDHDDYDSLPPSHETLALFDSCIAELWHVTNDVATSRHRIDAVHSTVLRRGNGDCDFFGGTGCGTSHAGRSPHEKDDEPLLILPIVHWDEVMSTSTPNFNDCYYPETLSMPSPMLTDVSLSSQSPSLITACTKDSRSPPTDPLLQHKLPRQPRRTKGQRKTLFEVDGPVVDDHSFATNGSSSQASTTSETVALHHRRIASLQVILSALCLVVGMLLSWQVARLQHQLHTMTTTASATAAAASAHVDSCSVPLPLALTQPPPSAVDECLH